MEAAQAAAALRYYALGLSAYAALKVLVNAFYAIDRRKTPMFVSFSAVALNLLLNWVFTRELGWGHRGLAFSTACLATSNFLLLYILMRAELRRLHTGLFLSLLARLLPGAAVLAGLCWLGSHYLLADWASQPFWSKLAALLLTIAVAGGGFIAVASASGIPELQEITAAVRRRLRRRS
jgi:putative peptidoglycan lipid II flippase